MTSILCICFVDIVVNKTTERVPISATPKTSTPNAASSPLITPHGTPFALESPLEREKMAAAIVHSVRANSSSPALKPSSPVIVPANVGGSMSMSSPRAVTALVSNMMRSAKVPIKPASNGSPVLSAKALLHSTCPSAQQAPVSPLVKSSAVSVGTQSPSTLSKDARMLSTNPTSARGSPSTPLGSQSHKVVTVSKLPSPEQLTSLLQQLQQNSSLSKLISTAANTVVSRQLFNGGASSIKGNASSVTSSDPVSNLAQTRQQGGQTETD